jgi:hypothetical protein
MTTDQEVQAELSRESAECQECQVEGHSPVVEEHSPVEEHSLVEENSLAEERLGHRLVDNLAEGHRLVEENSLAEERLGHRLVDNLAEGHSLVVRVERKSK